MADICRSMTGVEAKLDRLRAMVKRLGPTAVAYSGGVDSTFLLKIALEELGKDAVAIIARGEVVPARELNDALATARSLGTEPVMVNVDLLSDPHFRMNPRDRCYVCKRTIFSAIQAAARERGLATVADGSHAGDQDADRPGMRALRELGVRSPLTEAGMDKEEVRAASKLLALPTADRPAGPCLATRIPFGREITARNLWQVNEAEEAVRGLGIIVVRVRHHGDLARIEVLPSDVPILRASLDRLAVKFQEMGFQRVEVDPRGYRSGSLSEGGEEKG